jgi:hypothetical protein
VLSIPVVVGALPMWILLHPPCANSPTPAEYGLPDYRTVSIPGPDGVTWPGYFIPGVGDGAPSRTGAVIVAPGALGAGVGGTLYETHIIPLAGYNLLTVGAVVCGRGGVHSLGYVEAAQIDDVVAYLNNNPDGITVDPDKIAIHGYSSAGAAAIFAAARNPGISAVLAEGNYYNLDAYLSTSQTTNFLEALLIGSARVTYRVATGHDASVLNPLQAIGDIPPRPVFLIYGSLEAERGGARFLLERAQAAVRSAGSSQRFPQLWIVPGVGHGGYVQTGTAYGRYVVSFYDCALFEECAAWYALWN